MTGLPTNPTVLGAYGTDGHAALLDALRRIEAKRRSRRPRISAAYSRFAAWFYGQNHKRSA
jgi:hypothetical protein